jgi:hypothetical protein
MVERRRGHHGAPPSAQNTDTDLDERIAHENLKTKI